MNRFEELKEGTIEDVALLLTRIANVGCYGRASCPAFVPQDKFPFYICKGGRETKECTKCWIKWLNKESEKEM